MHVQDCPAVQLQLRAREGACQAAYAILVGQTWWFQKLSCLTCSNRIPMHCPCATVSASALPWQRTLETE